MYKIEGKTIYPLPSEVFQWSCRTGKTLYKLINVPFVNENKEEAIKLIKKGNDTECINPFSVEEEEKEEKNYYEYKVNIKVIYIIYIYIYNFKLNVVLLLLLLIIIIIIQIEYSSEYFTGPKEFTFNTDVAIRNLENDGFDIPISFTPEVNIII